MLKQRDHRTEFNHHPRTNRNLTKDRNIQQKQKAFVYKREMDS